MSAVNDDYAKLKVAELKERSKERGLSVTGKKAELLARLQGAHGSGLVDGHGRRIICGLGCDRDRHAANQDE